MPGPGVVSIQILLVRCFIIIARFVFQRPPVVHTDPLWKTSGGSAPGGCDLAGGVDYALRAFLAAWRRRPDNPRFYDLAAATGHIQRKVDAFRVLALHRHRLDGPFGVTAVIGGAGLWSSGFGCNVVLRRNRKIHTND